MQYPHMKFCRLLSELDSEEKARAWIWLAKFDGKEFVCPQCNNEVCWRHHKNPEVRECKKCHFEVRLRANTIFQHSKTSLLVWLRAICLVTQGKPGISALCPPSIKIAGVRQLRLPVLGRVKHDS